MFVAINTGNNQILNLKKKKNSVFKRFNPIKFTLFTLKSFYEKLLIKSHMKILEKVFH